jgi:hypothetical protein
VAYAEKAIQNLGGSRILFKVDAGAFILEANPIPVGALLLSSFMLKPKKAAGIVAVTRELLAGSPMIIELSLRTLLAQDIGLLIDLCSSDYRDVSVLRCAV